MPEDIRDAFFNQICEYANADSNVVVITDDMDVYALRKFQRDHPEQFINPGVAEQQIINLAAGMASCGKRVIVCGIASFMTYRCYEQIRINIGSMKLPVAIVGIGVGLSFAFDGPTHHGIHDIAVMRSIPEFEIYNPCDAATARKCAEIVYKSSSPVYVRIDKGCLPDIYKSQYYLDVGNCEIFEGTNINILSTGITTHIVLPIAQELQVGLLDIFRLKPFDDRLTYDLAGSDVITVEEHGSGGLTSLLLESISRNCLSIKVHPIHLKDDQYLEYGSREWLREKSGLSLQRIRDMILALKSE